MVVHLPRHCPALAQPRLVWELEISSPERRILSPYAIASQEAKEQEAKPLKNVLQWPTGRVSVEVRLVCHLAVRLPWYIDQVKVV